MSVICGVSSIYLNAASHLFRIGFICCFVTSLVSAPTAYDRVQNRQYVGQTAIATVARCYQQKNPDETYKLLQGVGDILTKKQRLVWITVHEVIKRRVVFLV